MPLELVQTTTRDGVRLDGSFQSANGPPTFALDAVCLVHGTGGNFYSSTLFDGVADFFRQRGCGVLRINTRGHDGVSTAVTAQGGRRLGAAYEVVDDCRHDLAAWVEWLRQRAGPRVGLVGHSLGAVKCLYAVAREPLAPTCVVAVSPPRLSHSWFAAAADGAPFLATYAVAEQHVRDGQPAVLLDVKVPLPFLITAEGYVEKYGPDERYNLLRFVGAVTCPTLVTLGSVEVAQNMAFRGLPEALLALDARPPHFAVVTIPGADHFYSTGRPALLARVEAWLRTALQPV